MLDNAVGHSLRICVAINIKYDSFLVCKETEDTQLRLLLLLLLLSLLGWAKLIKYSSLAIGHPGLATTSLPQLVER